MFSIINLIYERSTTDQWSSNGERLARKCESEFEILKSAFEFQTLNFRIWDENRKPQLSMLTMQAKGWITKEESSCSRARVLMFTLSSDLFLSLWVTFEGKNWNRSSVREPETFNYWFIQSNAKWWNPRDWFHKKKTTNWKQIFGAKGVNQEWKRQQDID